MQKFSDRPIVSLGILFRQIGGVLDLLVSTGMAVLSFWGIGSVEASPTQNILNDPR